MKSLKFGVVVCLSLFLTGLASAQAPRTWVSGVGDDANPCSRTAPCKTFAGAISKTAPAGEIDCLDPGGFGAVTITKSIIIDCDSGAGGVLVAGTNGIVINANAATDIIILRNLTISGGGGGTLGINGVNVLAAKSVGLEDVVINGFSNNCLNVGSSAGNVTVYADDSKFINCTQAGVGAGQNAKVTITRSLIFGTGQGVSQSSTGSQVFITGSTVGSTGTAFQSSAGDFIGVSGCTLSNNGVVYNQNGGSISSGGDNAAFGNGATGSATGTSVSKI